jgi:toxin ParE1/3/4
MKKRVEFDADALRDLLELFDYLEDRFGTTRAAEYTERIRSYCLRLGDFPELGRDRGDLEPGLRVIGFERRVLIAYLIQNATVSVIRILYGGREFGSPPR